MNGMIKKTYERDNLKVAPLFKVGQWYSHGDVFKIIGLGDGHQGQIYYSGYFEHNGSFYIFANIGTPGSTGDDYPNYFEADHLVYYGKRKSNLSQPQIQSLSSDRVLKHVFYREIPSGDYKYLGLAKNYKNPKYNEEVDAVEFAWTFDSINTDRAPYVLPEEVDEGIKYNEGSVKQIMINAYERNQDARRKCLDLYGYACAVCGFDFEKKYGEIGRKFIHVHHIVKISDIKESYNIDPEKDLVPICPNCHAMIHHKKEPLSIDELKNIVNKLKG